MQTLWNEALSRVKNRIFIKFARVTEFIQLVRTHGSLDFANFNAFMHIRAPRHHARTRNTHVRLNSIFRLSPMRSHTYAHMHRLRALFSMTLRAVNGPLAHAHAFLFCAG